MVEHSPKILASDEKATTTTSDECSVRNRFFFRRSTSCPCLPRMKVEAEHTNAQLTSYKVSAGFPPPQRSNCCRLTQLGQVRDSRLAAAVSRVPSARLLKRIAFTTVVLNCEDIEPRQENNKRGCRMFYLLIQQLNISDKSVSAAAGSR